jgi:hypothetical protein
MSAPGTRVERGDGPCRRNSEVGRKRAVSPVRLVLFYSFLFYSFSFLFSNLEFKFKSCVQFFLNLYCEIINTNFGVFLGIYIIYFSMSFSLSLFLSLLSFSYFQNPNFHLGFNPTSSDYYLIILVNAQTYKCPTRCTFFYFSIICFN